MISPGKKLRIGICDLRDGYVDLGPAVNAVPGRENFSHDADGDFGRSYCLCKCRSVRATCEVATAETDPTTAPSSRIAMIDPTGRGDEPQVCTTVASRARRPCARQSRRVRITDTSTFSMWLGDLGVRGCQALSSAASNGRSRRRLPVSLNTAPATAGASGGRPTSPTPPGLPPDCRTFT